MTEKVEVQAKVEAKKKTSVLLNLDLDLSLYQTLRTFSASCYRLRSNLCYKSVLAFS